MANRVYYSWFLFIMSRQTPGLKIEFHLVDIWNCSFLNNFRKRRRIWIGPWVFFSNSCILHYVCLNRSDYSFCVNQVFEFIPTFTVYHRWKNVYPIFHGSYYNINWRRPALRTMPSQLQSTRTRLIGGLCLTIIQCCLYWYDHR